MARHRSLQSTLHLISTLNKKLPVLRRFAQHEVRLAAVAALLTVPAVSTVTVGAAPKSAHTRLAKGPRIRLSVIDYFYLLPRLGIGYPGTRRHKRELLQPNASPIIDVRHDYLLVHPDSSPAEQLAVFRAPGKPDLIADSLPEFDSDYNNLTLYRLQRGKLKDVTRRMLPILARADRYVYELLRVGTTIRVFRADLVGKSRRHAFDLQWHGGRFVKVRRSRPVHA